jgi:hypothetical protein
LRFSEKEPIQYEFSSDYTVRYRINLPDTFNVRVLDFNTTMELSTGYIKLMSFEIQKNKDFIPVLIEKHYTSDVLLNRTIFPER